MVARLLNTLQVREVFEDRVDTCVGRCGLEAACSQQNYSNANDSPSAPLVLCGAVIVMLDFLLQT